MKKIEPVLKIEKILNRYVKENDTILDIGCGCGIYRKSTLGKYTGLDITDEDYSEGNKRHVDIVASATEIPLPDNHLDLIFAVSSFYLIPEYEKALREFHRVLRPGGRVLLFDYNKKTQQYLNKQEGKQYPCWTQKELEALLKTNGFKKTRILLMLNFNLPFFLHYIAVLYNERRLGGRAIVTGVKS